MPLQSFLFQRLTRIFFLRYCPNYISSTSVGIYLNRLDLKRTCWFLTFTLFVMLIKWTNVSGLPMTKIRIFDSKPRFAYSSIRTWKSELTDKFSNINRWLKAFFCFNLPANLKKIQWWNKALYIHKQFSPFCSHSLGRSVRIRLLVKY